MVLETTDGFSFERKEDIDMSNPHIAEWERIMWEYQQTLPNTKTGEKWRLMKNIYTMS